MPLRSRWAVLLTLAVSPSACGGDDAGGELSWECYANTMSGTCDCFSHAADEDFDYGATHAEPVDDCEGHAVCFSYEDEFFEDPTCSCGDDEYMPAAGSTDVVQVDDCPEPG